MFIYCAEKNSKLIEERGVSFEEVIAAIENDKLLDVLEHPNQTKYKDQKIYVIELNEYIFLVPFVIDAEGNYFLKTIIPSRKANQKYSRRK